MDGELQLEQAAVEYAAGKLHQVKKARGLPTLSAVFLRGNIFSENWVDQLGGPFDCVHVGGSCAKERIHDLMRLVKEGVPVEIAHHSVCFHILNPMVSGSMTTAFAAETTLHCLHPRQGAAW